MRTLLVVIFAPAFDFLPRVFQAREPVRVQTFIPQPPVEAFYICVLRWLARLNVFQANTTLLAPGSQCSTAKLRSLVQHNGFRQSTLLDDSIEHTPHAQTAQASVDFHGRAFARVIVHQGQDPNHLSTTDTITDKID